MKTSNGQGPTDNDDFSDATMIDSSLQDENPAWQGNEAPIDDFNDPAAEGMAHVTEAAEGMEGIEQPANSAESKSKKSLKILPIAAGIGGVLFIGAMLYLQFGSAPSSPVALLSPKPQAQTHTEFPKALTAAPNETVAPTSSLTPVVAGNNNAISTAQSASAPTGQKGIALPGTINQNPAMSPQTATVAEANAAAVPDKKPSLNEAASLTSASGNAPAATPDLPTTNHSPSPQTEPPAAIKASPDIDGLKPVATTALLPEYETGAAKVTPPATIQASAESERIAKLSSQIESLHKELETTQQQLAQANLRLQEMQSEKASASKLQNQTATLSVGDDNFFKAQEKSALLASSSKKKTKPHKPARSHKTTNAAQEKNSANKEVWILRAATPDEAWVAKGENSRAIHPVRVGDMLQGIGRVTAIRQDGDRWIVEGTQGMVR